jgi:hypothetical protein
MKAADVIKELADRPFVKVFIDERPVTTIELKTFSCTIRLSYSEEEAAAGRVVGVKAFRSIMGENQEYVIEKLKRIHLIGDKLYLYTR